MTDGRGREAKPVSTAAPFYGYLAMAQRGADVDFGFRNGIVGQHRAFQPFHLSWVSGIFQLREQVPCTQRWFVRIALLEENRKLTSLVTPQWMVKKKMEEAPLVDVEEKALTLSNVLIGNKDSEGCPAQGAPG